MNSRERVLAVLNRKIPDSVPHALYDVAIDIYNDSTIELFREKTGKHPRDCFRHDIRGISMRPQVPEQKLKILQPELPDINDIESILPPIITAPRRSLEDVKREVDKLHDAEYAVMAIGQVSDFETPFSIRGREQFYLDLGYNDEWLKVFLDKITDAAIADAVTAITAGADIFGIGDDLGSQRALLISPDQWRELFKPRLKRIVDAVHNTNCHAKFFLHSDGNIESIIPDLIEIGVDILNPIQPEVMDPSEVKRKYGDKLIFFGAISVQHTLPFGSPDDVRNEVKLRMQTIGKEGGYIMTPSHIINADIPWENIEAYFDAANEYGIYA